MPSGWAPPLAAAGALVILLSTTTPDPRPVPFAIQVARFAAPSDLAPPPLTRSLAHEAGAKAQVPAQIDTVFRHAQHEAVACLSCHTMDPAHGEIRVRTLADCRGCHHAAEPPRECAVCHAQSDAPTETLTLQRAFDFSVGRMRERTLAFEHSQHTAVACGSCHTDGLSLSAERATCNGCHVEHHQPEARCTTCHVPVLEAPHEVEAHVGCGGSGCHTTMPFTGMPRERAACVACHKEQEEHRPGRECIECHLLPPERPSGPGG